MPDDPYASLPYRSVIAWPQRLAREWPLLEAVFSGIPSRRLLDLGSGSGEHADFLASKGFDVVGVEQSPSMLEQAREAVRDARVRFIAGDITDVGRLTGEAFGGAICLGNTLPSIRTRHGLSRLFSGLRARLLPGATFVLQVLNYEKIFATGQRHLPLTMRPADDGTLVFLRLMEPRPGGDLIFSPVVLRYRPEADPTVVLEASERIEVHGWTRRELEDVLEEAGFRDRECYGSVSFSPYVAGESPDVVILAK